LFHLYFGKRRALLFFGERRGKEVRRILINNVCYAYEAEVTSSNFSFPLPLFIKKRKKKKKRR
jgi:hypothetical protein